MYTCNDDVVACGCREQPTVRQILCQHAWRSTPVMHSLMCSLFSELYVHL